MSLDEIKCPGFTLKPSDILCPSQQIPQSLYLILYIELANNSPFPCQWWAGSSFYWLHIGRLKSALAEVFMPQTLAKAYCGPFVIPKRHLPVHRKVRLMWIVNYTYGSKCSTHSKKPLQNPRQMSSPEVSKGFWESWVPIVQCLWGPLKMCSQCLHN